MTNKVRFTFDIAVQDMLPREDIITLTESLYSFIDHGIIDCEDDEEIFIDQEFLEKLIVGIDTIRKANKKYGRDDDGLVKFPFGVV